MLLNLQFFSEEGSTDQFATGTESETIEGSATDVATATAEESVERPSFDELIKGDYKKEFEAKKKEAVQRAVSKRFKNQADLQGQLDRLNPILDLVGGRYGIVKGENGYDIDAIQRKLEEDNSMYEQEAFERNMDVETLKQIKQLERQNQLLERQQQEYERRQGFEKLVREGEELKQIYPEFNLDEEMMNETFGRLIANGIPIKAAYEVAHLDDVKAAERQQTKEDVSKAIQSGQRPSENISNVSSAKLGAIDPSKLTHQQYEDIMRRVQSGEQVTFA